MPFMPDIKIPVQRNGGLTVPVSEKGKRKFQKRQNQRVWYRHTAGITCD
jgi:hypothetical protein